jgi:hypothetical protein
MDNDFIQFDDFIINDDEKVIGFLSKDLYLEMDISGIEMFRTIQESEHLYTLEELSKLFEEIDVEELISQLKELEVISFVKDKGTSFTKERLKNQGNIHINITYMISSIIMIYNLIFLSKNVHNIFVLDLQYFKTPIVLFIFMFFLETILACCHEFGHYLAAKSLKIKTSLNISQRFILFMVFECKMNGVWLLDKYKRMFPMLGGILMDNFIIFLCSFAITLSKGKFTILSIILFIQYTKMIYHLLIPFKTDLYYLILFRFHNYRYERNIIFISYILGYLLLIPLIVVYFIQFINLFLYMRNAPIFQNILVILILLVPVLLFVRERRKQNA